MKIAATIQARMGSTRLPGKVLKPIMGRPVLGYMLERVRRSKLLNQIIIATSTNPKDDEIEEFAKSVDVPVFRGSEEDVLGRLVGALKKFNVDVHVELMGDCLLSDPDIIDDFVQFYLDHDYDYVSNNLKTTYPPGLEVAVYDAKLLIEAEAKANDPRIREHGSLYIRLHPEKYKIFNIEAPKELFYPDMYIELDTQEDLEVIKAIYENLYVKNPNFSSLDVVNFLTNNPRIRDLNKNVERRWKEFRKDD